MYDLVGVDGNAFAIMGYTMRAMKECGFTDAERSEYQNKCYSGDYDNLLSVSIDMIDKCNERAEN